MENSRKWKLIYSDRKQTGGSLVMDEGVEEREGGVTKKLEETFEGDMFIILMVVMVSQVSNLI